MTTPLGSGMEWVNVTYLSLMERLNTLADLMSTAQDEWVWVRSWQWILGNQIKVLAGSGIERAAVQVGDDPLSPTDPALREARDLYDQGVQLLDERQLDDALDVYIDARCLVVEIYNRAGFEPAAEPPSEWACEACVASGDCAHPGYE